MGSEAISLGAIVLFTLARLYHVHIGDFFKREASDFFLAPMDTGIFYSTAKITGKLQI